VTDDQLSLFPLSRPSARDEADALPRGSDEPLIDAYAEVRALAARLPPLLRFGTSSWSFPGAGGPIWRVMACTSTHGIRCLEPSASTGATTRR
jgi:hypothetical protein